MTNPPLTDIMSEDWAQALAPVEDKIHAMGEFYRRGGHRTFPTGQNILRAFSRPMNEVKVLIVGKTLPHPGNAMGLSGSSVQRICLTEIAHQYYQELHDLGIEPAPFKRSELVTMRACWANRVLSVREGAPGSHRNKGWEEVTECAGRWRHAISPWSGRCGVRRRRTAPMLEPYPCVESAATVIDEHRGFFGSRLFSRAEGLVEQGAELKRSSSAHCPPIR